MLKMAFLLRYVLFPLITCNKGKFHYLLTVYIYTLYKLCTVLFLVFNFCMYFMHFIVLYQIVPYRDTKLTHLFKNFFDGEGKVSEAKFINYRIAHFHFHKKSLRRNRSGNRVKQ